MFESNTTSFNRYKVYVLVSTIVFQPTIHLTPLFLPFLLSIDAQYGKPPLTKAEIFSRLLWIILNMFIISYRFSLFDQ